MAFRQLLRGRVEPARAEAVAREVATRYGDERAVAAESVIDAGERSIEVEILEADNWLSTPCVVDGRWFVKIITAQNALVHGLLTTGRNLGMFSRGTEGFFERFEDPVEMAAHELDATRRMRELGVNAPQPLEAFGFEDLGVLVLEYLPAFRTLDGLGEGETRRFAPVLFASLARLHDAGLAHGDLRAENVLLADDQLYFIDATNVRAAAIDDARSYDLACALAALEPAIGARAAVDAALGVYDVDDLLAAREFVGFVDLRPDHDFDAALLRGELEKRAA